jgi:hypothetical protein
MRLARAGSAPSGKTRRGLVGALLGGFAAIWITILLLAGTAAFTQWAHSRANSKCQAAQPANAWGYTIEWDWGDRAYICRYQARDYSFTGDRKRVTFSDL